MAIPKSYPLQAGEQVVCITAYRGWNGLDQKVGDVFTIAEGSYGWTDTWAIKIEGLSGTFSGKRFELYNPKQFTAIYDDPTYAELFE